MDIPKRNPARVRRTFTPQFKKDAVAMVRSGKAVTEVSNSMGVDRSLLQYWKRQLDGEAADPFPRDGNANSEDEDFRALMKNLKNVTEERDILKSALSRPAGSVAGSRPSRAHPILAISWSNQNDESNSSSIPT